MTEKNELKSVPTEQNGDVSVAETAKKESGGANTEAVRSEHKPSNLRGRWKRNTAGTATIKESDAKLPKEIKTIKIESSETFAQRSKVNVKADSKGNQHKRECKKNACDVKTQVKEKKSQNCCSLCKKIKCFVLKLFGVKCKKEEPRSQNYRKSQRNHSRRRNFRNNGNRRQNRQ